LSFGKKVQENPAPGASPVGKAATAATASTVSSGRSLSGRDQGPTQQAAGDGSPEGGNAGSTGKPPGGQPNGGTGSTTGPSRTPGNGGSSGSRNSSSQSPAEGAPLKRDTTGTKRVPEKFASQTSNVDSNTSGPKTVNAKNTSQPAGQSTSSQTSSTNSGGSSSGPQKAAKRAAAEDKVQEPSAIKARAQSDNPPQSTNSMAQDNPAGSNTSSSSGTSKSSAQGLKKVPSTSSGN
jgi:hypothetical protein